MRTAATLDRFDTYRADKRLNFELADLKQHHLSMRFHLNLVYQE